MQVQDLLTADFTLTDKLEPTMLRELSVAAQFLDSPLPRAHPGVSPESLADQQASRREKMLDAERIALELVEPSAYDLQVLVVVLRSTLEVRGVEDCLLVLRLLCKMLGEPWARLASEAELLPAAERKKVERKRGRFIDAVIERIFDALARRESSGSSVADAEGTGEQGLALDAAWGEALQLLEVHLEARNLRPARWEALVERVRSLSRAVAVEELLEGPPFGPPAGAPESASREPALEASDGSSCLPGAVGVSGSGTTAQLRVSPRFWELMERLQAFRWCLEHEAFEKAALVARDLQGRLEAFDAPSHFPELFADFFEGLASYSTQLEEGMREDRSVRTQSLSRLYQTDIARFLEDDCGRRAQGSPAAGGR